MTLAKKEVYGQVGIDMLAGPSEILIIADGAANAAYVAADMLSQAEHDRRSRSIVLTDDEGFADILATETARQCALLPRKEICGIFFGARRRNRRREGLEGSGGARG